MHCPTKMDFFPRFSSLCRRIQNLKNSPIPKRQKKIWFDLDLTSFFENISFLINISCCYLTLSLVFMTKIPKSLCLASNTSGKIVPRSTFSFIINFLVHCPARTTPEPWIKTSKVSLSFESALSYIKDFSSRNILKIIFFW